MKPFWTFILIVAAALIQPHLAHAETLEPSNAFSLQLPGFSHHFASAPNGHEWTDVHAGLGFEVARPLTSPEWDGWQSKTTVGVMRDSLASWGSYAGYTIQKRVWSSDQFTLDAGAGAFLFYRRFEFDGHKRFMPGVLPTLTIEHRQSGLGANFIVVPGFSWNRQTMPATAFIQFTKRF